MPLQKLTDFLDDNFVHYVIIKHSRAYTAQTVAYSAHIRARDLAKVVIIYLDEKMAMVVLPASDSVDLDLLRESTGSQSVRLAKELEFRNVFPECEPGAMPPFGNLYDMEVFVSSHLTEDELIAFNAGTHTELIQLSYSDFSELVSPVVIRLSKKDQ
jgi:Ala-tRNA(Pro) deacylase